LALNFTHHGLLDRLSELCREHYLVLEDRGHVVDHLRQLALVPCDG